MTRTGSTEPLKITDFTSQQKWRRTTLYNEFFHPLRCEYQMGFAFPLPKGQIALGFNCAARDYSEDDRQLFTLLRPHLMQAYMNALTLTRITNAMTGMNRACVVARGRRHNRIRNRHGCSLSAEAFRSAGGTELVAATIEPLVAETSWCRAQKWSVRNRT